jgi:hypothetical protein
MGVADPTLRGLLASRTVPDHDVSLSRSEAALLDMDPKTIEYGSCAPLTSLIHVPRRSDSLRWIDMMLARTSSM